MSYRRILTIQDISCVGQCSTMVALPILSACGHESCVLPSAVLSTHTDPRFGNYTFRDLSGDFPKIIEHWKEEGIKFDAVYTGYLGNAEQIEHVEEIAKSMMNPGGQIIVDPVMADNGELYRGFDDKFVAEMRYLCSIADVILPNITEACFLSGAEYKETYSERNIDEIINGLKSINAKSVILTGVNFDEEKTGIMICDNGACSYYSHKRYPRTFIGTGDIFSSAFSGALVCGKSIKRSAEIAADFTVACIENTYDDPSHWYGVKFEPVLPKLIKMISE